MHITEEDKPDQAQEYTLYPIQDPAAKPLQTTVMVEVREILMEVNTGTSVTVISEATLGSMGRTAFSSAAANGFETMHYTGAEIPVVGGLEVKVQYKG